MIDLSQFAGKRIRVTFRDGLKKEGYLGFEGYPYPYTYVFSYQSSEYSVANISYNRGGKVMNNQMLDIVKIEELESVIDLSKFVDKNVKVSYRNGEKAEVIIQDAHFGDYPYRINGVATYAENGLVYGSLGNEHPNDIVNIELLDSGNRVEYLENRVQILQREIDSANAEIAKIKNEKKVIAQDGDWRVEKREGSVFILYGDRLLVNIEYEAFISLVDQCSDLVNTPD